MRFIPYGRQEITEEDIKSVLDTLSSDYLTQGPRVELFEKEVNQYLNCKYSISVNSATSALHIACMALGLKNGDYLWTSPITFVASANCARYCDAYVDFVDIDIKTGLISIEKLKEKLVKAKKENCLPKVLVPVHLTGTSCNMEEIYKLSQIYKFKIIEDASHCFGAEYKNLKVGSCKFSDITVFSFHPVKIITTGEGGIATTNDPKLAQDMQKLRSHGITKDEKLFKTKSLGPWFYEQQDLGYNYRITDIQASLGLSQLKRIDQIVKERQRLRNIYEEALSNEPITFLQRSKDVYSSVHLVVIVLNEKFKNFYKEIFISLRKAKIGVQLHYLPVHLQPYYKNLDFKEGDFPAAELYSKLALSLPVFPGLDEREQEYVIEKLKFFLRKYKL
tara:strand:- start:441 stop:1613 length:1173 start_codon:yes stop_codon:yes gene_type:complete